MADNTTPNRAANQEEAEGDRSTAEQNDDRTTGDEGGGITNRPLDEEIASQESVPDRGRKKDQRRMPVDERTAERTMPRDD